MFSSVIDAIMELELDQDPVLLAGAIAALAPTEESGAEWVIEEYRESSSESSSEEDSKE